MTSNRHALIVGGTKGLGRALADFWSQAGRRVSVVGRTATEIPAGSSIAGWAVDLCRPESIHSVIERIIESSGPIDDVVFAQRARGGTDPWQDEIATSLTGTASVMASLESSWQPERRPAVVMVTSLAGRMVALEQQAGYHAAKAGLEQLTRYYAATLACRGVRVNAVIPGIVRRDRSDQTVDARTSERAYLSAIPLGRLAEAVDVVEGIDFLCSPRAGYITGQTLVIDGGLSLLMQHALAAKIFREAVAPVGIDDRHSPPELGEKR